MWSEESIREGCSNALYLLLEKRRIERGKARGMSLVSMKPLLMRTVEAARERQLKAFGPVSSTRVAHLDVFDGHGVIIEKDSKLVIENTLYGPTAVGVIRNGTRKALTVDDAKTALSFNLHVGDVRDLNGRSIFY